MATHEIKLYPEHNEQQQLPEINPNWFGQWLEFIQLQTHAFYAELQRKYRLRRGNHLQVYCN
ncbi:hypothetical protein [Paenibacillus sp. MMS18-CY102]|uniref:hypothetical protein n=1 Tax=Paenibacillus sp. MMS18-CY102 TaxID=2682849 RepID=UPI00136588BB|nr:hypothetical protein [Paenibacillus sp. MMS18-CY102]MWC27167.1 hypothetical protein [Paenibacillus sp. MMS18-CY102]